MTESTGRLPFSAQRQQAIVRTLRTHGRVDVAEIAAQLDVTHETVRKDLIGLEQRGLLRRVHGGAVPIEHLTFEPVVSARVELIEEKQRIARAAFEPTARPRRTSPHTGARPACAR